MSEWHCKMSAGVRDYLQTDYRPRKRAAQRDLYSFAASYLKKGPLNVVDLPSVDLQDYNSIRRMRASGISIGNYYAYESSPSIYKTIRPLSYRKRPGGSGRVLVRNKDVLADLTDRSGRDRKFHGQKVDLFNLDFCTALADTHSVFKMIHGMAMHMGDPAALIITCSLRTGVTAVKAEDAIRHAVTETFPALYNVNVSGHQRRTYKDTAPMVSNCFILTRKEPKKTYSRVIKTEKPVKRRRGRPRLPVSKAQVQKLIASGRSIRATAKLLGVSNTLVRSRLKE